MTLEAEERRAGVDARIALTCAAIAPADDTDQSHLCTIIAVEWSAGITLAGISTRRISTDVAIKDL